MLYDITLPAEASMVGIARDAAKLLLGDCPRTDDARLILSEYFTNAIRHSRSSRESTVRVRLAVAPGHLRIEVEDDGPLPPGAPQHADEPDVLREYGRGLAHIVDRIADKWGHDTYPDRSVAWAELPW